MPKKNRSEGDVTRRWRFVSSERLAPTYTSADSLDERESASSEPRGAEIDPVRLCPTCRGEDVIQGADHQGHCARCGQTVLLLPREARQDGGFAVPVSYGRYRAIRVAGQGGMGIVLRGLDVATGKPVAIKLITNRDRSRNKAIARFHREVAALRGIRHANVVRLLSHGTIGNQRYLVMDWVEGPNFRDLVAAFRQRRHWPACQRAEDWLMQTCRGLAAIHGAGVIHRDLKPSNLMLDSMAILRITDFGIARLSAGGRAPSAPDGGEQQLGLEASSGPPLGRSVTAAGELLGTPNYMAPECVRSASAASSQSDLYSLGVTFYEISTGERPLIAWPPPSAFNRSLSPTFDSVIMKLLAKNPAERFSSAHEVALALDGTSEAPPGETALRSVTHNPQ